MNHERIVFDRYGREHGLEGPTVGVLMAVVTFEPEPTSPAHLLEHGLYTAARPYLAQSAAATGHLVDCLGPQVNARPGHDGCSPV